jgi:hypothetical protein
MRNGSRGGIAAAREALGSNGVLLLAARRLALIAA